MAREKISAVSILRAKASLIEELEERRDSNNRSLARATDDLNECLSQPEEERNEWDVKWRQRDVEEYTARVDLYNDLIAYLAK